VRTHPVAREGFAESSLPEGCARGQRQLEGDDSAESSGEQWCNAAGLGRGDCSIGSSPKVTMCERAPDFCLVMMLLSEVVEVRAGCGVADRGGVAGAAACGGQAPRG
jgi:hypothetical protein